MTSWANAAPVIVVVFLATFVNIVVWNTAFPQISKAVSICRNEIISPPQNRATGFKPSPPITVLHGGGLGSHRPTSLDNNSSTSTLTSSAPLSTAVHHDRHPSSTAVVSTQPPEETTTTNESTTADSPTVLTTTTTEVPSLLVDDTKANNDTNSNSSFGAVAALVGDMNTPGIAEGGNTTPTQDDSSSSSFIPPNCHLGALLANILDPPTLPFGFGLGDLVWTVWLTLIGIMASWAFMQAVCVDPGHVPHAFLQSSPKSSTLAIKLTGALTLCPPCAAFKPLRAHHCSRCGRCVLKYDHHCPWIGQCVGFFNYKLYLLFVFYTQWMSWTYIVLLLRPVLMLILGQVPCNAVAATILPSASCQMKAANWAQVVSLLLSLVAMGLTLYLLVQHWSLARANVTTVEAVIARWQAKEEPERLQENVYDLGVTKNLEQIFGDADWDHTRSSCAKWLGRLLPTAPYPPQSVEVRYSFQTYRSVLQPTPNPSTRRASQREPEAAMTTSLQSTAKVSYGTLQPTREDNEQADGATEMHPLNANKNSNKKNLTGTEAIESMLAQEEKYLGILYPTTIGRTIHVQ